jgi:hypothetical protein
VNDETVALKLALVALAGTVTLAGTATVALLLDRLTLSPLLPAGAFKFTVQASVPAADIDPLLHVRELNVPGAEAPEPLIFTTTLPCDELLAIVRIPVNELTELALNCRFSVVFCPGVRVTGVVMPEAVNSDPATEIDEIVTAAVPVAVSVTDCLAVCPTVTFPKLTLVELALSVGVPGFNCNANVFVAPSAPAVSVAD